MFRLTRRRLVLLLLSLALSYGGAVAFLMMSEDTILYRPARSSGSVRADVRGQDLWLVTAEGVRIHACWFPYPGARRALLFCHGNTGRTPEVSRLLDGLKMSLILFDYPGYGQSGGRPSEAGCYGAGCP